MILGSATSHRWYAVQTTAGHENKVMKLLQRKIESDPTPAEERLIRQVLVPTQKVVEIKNGKKVEVERKTFPGYVLVEMLLSQETLHQVNAIQGRSRRFRSSSGRRSRSPRARSPTSAARSRKSCPRRAR